MQLPSPYKNKTPEQCYEITNRLVECVPYKKEIVKSVLKAWDTLHNNSFIGNIPFMKMGFTGAVISTCMEQLIGNELAKRTGKFWVNQEYVEDKDFVCIDPLYSLECKVSGSKSNIPGNKHQCSKSVNRKKFRQGYYLVVNYTNNNFKIRVGWLDDEDWVAAKSASSSGCRVPALIQKVKLRTLYS
jgi:ScaI restriction endonuclease